MKKLILLISFILIHAIVTAQSWTALGSIGVQNIYATAFDQSGHLYATGINSDDQANVYQWDGTTWTILGGTNALNANAGIRALAIDPLNNVYAAGDFTNANQEHYVAKWDGSSWSETGTGSDALHGHATIFSLVIDSSNTVYTATTAEDGRWYVQQWNGTSWSKLTNHRDTADVSITSLALDPSGNLYANGFYQKNPGPGSSFNIGKWDGSNWTEVGTGSHSLDANSVIYAMACDRAGNLYATGYFTDGTTSSSGSCYVAQWNGTDWSQVGTGTQALSVNGSIHDLTLNANGNIYIGGSFKDVNQYYYVAKWDGTNWSELGIGIHALNVNSDIWCITVDSTEKVLASGGFTNTDNQTYVAEWNGAATGIQALQSGKTLPLYPNPGQGIVSVEMLEDTQLDIYNASGIYQSSKLIQKETTSIDLSFLKHGLYLLAFKGQQYKYASLKWVKE